MPRPVHQLAHLFSLLRRGDALVSTLQGTGRTWSLAGDGRTIDPDIADTLLKRRFGGGRLQPCHDHLPGLDGVGSQTWAWQATRPAPPRPAPPRPSPCAVLMAPRLSLAAWSGFGAPRVRRTRKPKPLTPEQQLEIAVERAHRCGLRYFARGWRRRFPPRFDHVRLPYHHPDQVRRRECRSAFYRGYDDGRRLAQARARAWAVDWPVAQAAE